MQRSPQPFSRRLLSSAEVGAQLGVSPRRVLELIRSGLLPAVRLGRQVRIDEMALATLIAGGGAAWAGGWRKQPAAGAAPDSRIRVVSIAVEPEGCL